MKKINVSLKGFSKTKKSPVKKVLPKSATVCLEGQKISKNGKCIKDKNYVVVMASMETSKMPGIPTVCMEGYKFSISTGKCRKISLGLSTVCKEGYKISKNGRCIKDRNYTTVFTSAKISEIPAPTVSSAVSVSGNVKLATAATVKEVKEILNTENIKVSAPVENKLVNAETQAEVKDILNNGIPNVPVSTELKKSDIISEVASAETQKEVTSVLKGTDLSISPDAIKQLAVTTDKKEVEKIIDDSNTVSTVGTVIPLTPDISSAISSIEPVDLLLFESESYVKKVFKENGLEYTGCSSLNEVLKKFKAKCIKEIGYATSLPQDKCISRHIKQVDIRYPKLKTHLKTLGCIITQKMITDFA